MPKILGLDLGTNSIGAAVIDNQAKEILGLFVNIFSAGVDNLGQGEKELSWNASRTKSRSQRKQYFRRKVRKQLLLKTLRAYGMAPNDEPAMKQWFQINPYQFRDQALYEEITLMQLGRVFYHMAQRRGFKSNSRSANANTDAKIYQSKEGKIGINDTLEALDGTTLGAYLNRILPGEKMSYVAGLPRARSRYTTRQLYVDEFEQIWACQTQYHLSLTTSLKNTIGGLRKDELKKDGIMFFSRALLSQKKKVGKCPFEKDKTRCASSHPLYEEYRAWQFANSIECNGYKLHFQSQQKVAHFLLLKDKCSFSDIRKRLDLMDSQYTFNYQDEDKIVGSITTSQLAHKKIFGDDWFSFTDDRKDSIWHVFLDFDDTSKFKEYAKAKWGFDDAKAEHAAKFFPKQGYASLSRKAIRNILYFLKLGYRYDLAVALAGVKNALGNTWDELATDEHEKLSKKVNDFVDGNLKGGFIEPLKEYLAGSFKLDENNFKKLYHHSADIHAGDLVDKLPTASEADGEIMKIRNPIVIQALFELRKLVNNLIERFGPFDEIRVELARDLKISKDERLQVRRDNQKREDTHDWIKGKLRALGQKESHDNILKYKLWQECKETCPYTGDSICVEQLFNGEVEIEHIFPYKRSGDDSYLNKTLCFVDENLRKGDKTPFEYYHNVLGHAKWEEVTSRALSLFHTSKEFPNRYKKFKRFVAEKFDEDFTSRQLNDTRYISVEARNYLKKVCSNVTVSPGKVTARLRHYWKLNSIIPVLDEKEENEEKNRADHRHHAIDALVLAVTDASHVMEISKRNKYQKQERPQYDFPEPLPNFRQQAIEAVKQIIVPHKQQKRVLTSYTHKAKKNGKIYVNKGVAARDELHLETLYGKRQAPLKPTPGFHVRKKLKDITDSAQINKIVDAKVRELILKRLQETGVDTTKKFVVPPGAFFEKDDKTEQVVPKIFLPNKKGDPVPVLKVRIREELGNAVFIGRGWVNPKNNHHAVIYRDFNNKLKDTIVTFWEAVERKKLRHPMFQIPPDGKELILTIRKNEMFVLGVGEEDIERYKSNKTLLSDHVYRVQNVSSKDYVFRKHLAATTKFDSQRIRITSFEKLLELNPIKVSVKPDGTVIWPKE